MGRRQVMMTMTFGAAAELAISASFALFLRETPKPHA
jgi:hypothetical protein